MPHFPQQDCSAFTNDWPYQDTICSNNAIGCDRPALTFNDSHTFSCVCKAGFTGYGDFTSKGKHDCHISDDVTFSILVIYFLSAALCAVVVFLWNFHAIKLACIERSKPKPIQPKTIANLSFIAESIWCMVGVTYRIMSGNRYGFDVISTVFISFSVVLFLWSFFFFVISWVKLSITASSSGAAKLEHKKKASKILRKLRNQLLVCVNTIVICLMSTALFIEEEDSELREVLISAANLTTALSATFLSVALYRYGSDLADVVRNAGIGDAKIKKIGDKMLITTKLLTYNLAIIAILLVIVTSFPFVRNFKAYVIPLTYTICHFVPIFISVLLTTPPWRSWKKKKNRRIDPYRSSNSTNTISIRRTSPRRPPTPKAHRIVPDVYASGKDDSSSESLTLTVATGGSSSAAV